jgi:hypothetical protein
MSFGTAQAGQYPDRDPGARKLPTISYAGRIDRNAGMVMPLSIFAQFLLKISDYS